MTTSENPYLTSIRAVEDPLERAAQANQFITNGRLTLAAMQDVRDAAIRESRTTPAKPTIDDIAARIRAKRNIVVDALRGPRA